MEQFLKQLDELLAEYKELRNNLSVGDLNCFITCSRSAIYRIAGQVSPYMIQFEDIIVKERTSNLGYVVSCLVGVVEALRKDVASGYMQSQAELIHGELFADFLEMAKH
jgi:hypothetical protein